MNQALNILHVVQGYTPAVGGTERVIQKISENLVRRYGDRVTVFTTTAAKNCELFWRDDQPSLPAGTEEINGVTVRRFEVFNKFNRARFFLAGTSYKLGLPFNDQFRALYNGPLVRGMTAAIAQSGADIIMASSFPLLHMHYALRGGQRAGIPVLLCGGLHPADDYGFNRPMIYRACRAADGVIAYTSYERDYLIAQGVNPAKITVTGVGVDPEPFDGADGAAIRARFGWAAGDPVVAFVGQQVPHKGIDLVVGAMTAVWAAHPNACLLIAGAQTSYSAEIERWIAALPEARRGRVGLIHNFPEAEKAAIFAACDLLAFPSAHESFGIVFLEAWLVGKPVIGVRVGAIESVVAEGVDGLLIEPRNGADLAAKIITLLDQPVWRKEMGVCGRQKVLEQYTWNAVADKFRAAYQGLAQGGRRSS